MQIPIAQERLPKVFYDLLNCLLLASTVSAELIDNASELAISELVHAGVVHVVHEVVEWVPDPSVPLDLPNFHLIRYNPV
jgi:hypothetical protein